MRGRVRSARGGREPRARRRAVNDIDVILLRHLNGRRCTLPAMMASSGASRGACGARRARAAAALYAVEVWRKSAVRSRARLDDDAGVVASKYARNGAVFGEDAYDAA